MITDRSIIRALQLSAVWCFAAVGPRTASAKPPSHEAETAAAWKALSSHDFLGAIQHADACISEFRGAAIRRQAGLTEGKVLVPNGIVKPEQKEAIAANGPLNDVATCYFIKALAKAKLNEGDGSAAAFAEAAKFPFARAFDPRGWFWSPAEVAERSLTRPELAEKTPHEIYTADAWDAYKRRDFDAAIRHADKCIGQFHDGAVALQKALLQGGKTLPVGLATDEEKQATFENGVLNDVATCLYIKGKSAQAKVIALVEVERVSMKKQDAAKYALRVVAWDAFSKGAKLTLSRCWDPQGWFWAPSAACVRDGDLTEPRKLRLQD